MAASLAEINNQFIRAAITGSAEEVLTLISKGANIEAVDEEGYTALMIAALYDHKKTVEVLLDKGAKIDVANKNGGTVITIASSYYHDEIFKTIQKHQAEIEDQTNSNHRVSLPFWRAGSSAEEAREMFNLNDSKKNR